MFVERLFQPAYVIGRVDVSWSPKVIAGDERGRKPFHALVWNAFPGGSCDQDRVPAFTRVTGGDDSSRARAPGSEDPPYGVGRKVGAVREADDGRLHTVTSGGVTTTFDYDAAGNLTTETLPSGNGYSETRSYDRAGRLTEVKNATGASVLRTIGIIRFIL